MAAASKNVNGGEYVSNNGSRIRRWRWQHRWAMAMAIAAAVGDSGGGGTMMAAVGDGDGGGDGSSPLLSSVVVYRVQKQRFIVGSRRWFGAQDSGDCPRRRPERKAEAEDGSAEQE